MRYWMTQSLLSNWLYYINSEDEQAEKAQSGFLSCLKREKQEETKAMQDGKRFEALVNSIVDGTPEKAANENWNIAARRFAKLCKGGQKQVPVSGFLTAGDLDFVLYGVCDYVKAGIIYDIKKVTRYEYGKYAASPQHPMYFQLLPEAARFDYLIFDGKYCYRETYRRCDSPPVEQIITAFIRWLRETGYMELYQAHWAMDSKKEEMIHVI